MGYRAMRTATYDFNFYVAGSSFWAVVVAEELVDGVDVKWI